MHPPPPVSSSCGKRHFCLIKQVLDVVRALVNRRRTHDFLQAHGIRCRTVRSNVNVEKSLTKSFLRVAVVLVSPSPARRLLSARCSRNFFFPCISRNFNLILYAIARVVTLLYSLLIVPRDFPLFNFRGKLKPSN